MITLVETDLTYLAQYYQLNLKRKNTNAYSSIDSTAESHAANQSGSGEIDLDEVIKSLKLDDPQNRFMVLSLLGHTDLVNMLDLLDKDKLVLGLKFFTKDKLLQIMKNLPKEELLKVLFQIFPKEELVSWMPVKELKKFLESTKIQFTDMLKVVQGLPQHTLARIYEAESGESAGNKSSKELIESIEKMGQKSLIKGVQSLPYRDILNFTTSLVRMNNDLFKEFNQTMLLRPLESSPKLQLVEGMKALDEDKLSKIVATLPDNLLAQVVSQIDANKLASVLESQYPDLLRKIAA